jgi:VanZ family protein
MLIEKDKPNASAWSFVCSALLIAQIFSLGSLPFEPFEPWNKLFHVLAYSALALMLWIATDGRHPVFVVVGVMMLGALDELRQAAIPARAADVFDFLADALAAGFTGVVLMWLTKSGAKKSCAESSQQ